MQKYGTCWLVMENYCNDNQLLLSRVGQLENPLECPKICQILRFNDLTDSTWANIKKTCALKTFWFKTQYRYHWILEMNNLTEVPEKVLSSSFLNTFKDLTHWRIGWSFLAQVFPQGIKQQCIQTNFFLQTHEQITYTMFQESLHCLEHSPVLFCNFL